MGTRKAPDDEVPEPAQAMPRNSPTPVMVWANGSMASVEISAAPPSSPRDGVCRCEACHASLAADWAARLL